MLLALIDSDGVVVAGVDDIFSVHVFIIHTACVPTPFSIALRLTNCGDIITRLVWVPTG